MSKTAVKTSKNTHKSAAELGTPSHAAAAQDPGSHRLPVVQGQGRIHFTPAIRHLSYAPWTATVIIWLVRGLPLGAPLVLVNYFKRIDEQVVGTFVVAGRPQCAKNHWILVVVQRSHRRVGCLQF